jgi:hypothetical protein
MLQLTAWIAIVAQTLAGALPVSAYQCMRCVVAVGIPSQVGHSCCHGVKLAGSCTAGSPQHEEPASCCSRCAAEKATSEKARSDSSSGKSAEPADSCHCSIHKLPTPTTPSIEAFAPLNQLWAAWTVPLATAPSVVTAPREFFSDGPPLATSVARQILYCTWLK